MLVTLKHIKALDFNDGMMSCHSPGAGHNNWGVTTTTTTTHTWMAMSMSKSKSMSFIPQLISNFAHVTAGAKCVDCHVI